MRIIPGLFFLFVLAPSVARAESEFAEPPTRGNYEPAASIVRASIGPALRVSQQAADGGLALAIDIGSRATGGRLFGSWVRVGSDRGLSEYTAELWIDFGLERRLHPIIAAGAGIARLEGSAGRPASTLGIGVLRLTLEYALPIEEADARVGIDALGNLPAIRSRSAENAPPWALLMARVGAGF
jgi:hypothetical protein